MQKLVGGELLIGTKSVLFGAHQFILHPVYVIAAWLKLYGVPNFRTFVCIFVHDWGYIGCPNIDGKEGVKHPEFGANIVCALFGNKYRDMVLFHSRTYAGMFKAKESKLCWADKYSIAFEFPECYLYRTKLTGELEEYMNEWKVYSGDELVSDVEWYKTINKRQLEKVEKIVGRPLTK